MKRNWAWTVSLILIVMTCCATAAVWATESSEGSEGELCVPLGNIEITAVDGVDTKREPVEFPHSIHFGYSCNRCHHKWTGTDQFLNCTTSGCHDLAAKPAKGDETPAYRYFKDAFHTSCIGCHKEMKQAILKSTRSNEAMPDNIPGAGPTGCKSCHPRD